jgi:hypothetical protein
MKIQLSSYQMPLFQRLRPIFKKIKSNGQLAPTVSLIALSSFFNIFQHLTVLFLIKYDKFILIRFLQMGDFSNETKNCDSSRNLD